MSTVVYHSGALGDFITCLPMIKAWRTRYPAESIKLLTRRPHALLAMEAGLADSWWDVDSAQAAFLFSESPAPELLKKLALFDHAFLFAGHDSPVVSHMRSAGIASVYAQPPFPSDRVHIVDYHLDLLPFDLPPGEWDTPLINGGLSPEHSSENYDIILHPGSGSRRKNWAIDNFQKLADQLRCEGVSLAWLIGPAESISPPMEDSVIRKDSLVEIAAALGKARLFIGNDSGISHLSASLGVSSVILFGPSDPVVWTPRGDHVRIVRGSCEHAPCHPGTPPEGCDMRCMGSISVEKVRKICGI